MNFRKLVRPMPRYSPGEIATAYMLDDGAIVGYCPKTREWLKWRCVANLGSRSVWKLNVSCGNTRMDAALLLGEVNDNRWYIDASEMNGFVPQFDKRRGCKPEIGKRMKAAHQTRKTRLSDLEKENKELRELFDVLVDAHYGTAYHHIGDGDGIPQETADRVVTMIRKIRRETE